MDVAQLDSLYNQFNSYILQHFIMFWTIILSILLLIGAALFYTAKRLIESGINKATKNARENIDALDMRIRDQQGQIDNLRREINEVKNSNTAITQEEGTWGPRLDKNSGVAVDATGRYFRISNHVFLDFIMLITEIQEGNENDALAFEGIPYPIELEKLSLDNAFSNATLRRKDKTAESLIIVPSLPYKFTVLKSDGTPLRRADLIEGDRISASGHHRLAH